MFFSAGIFSLVCTAVVFLAWTVVTSTVVGEARQAVPATEAVEGEELQPDVLEGLPRGLGDKPNDPFEVMEKHQRRFHDTREQLRDIRQEAKDILTQPKAQIQPRPLPELPERRKPADVELC